MVDEEEETNDECSGNSLPYGSNTTKEILMFLWRWKLLSTAALSVRFFPHLMPHSAYKRFAGLRKKELIGMVADPTCQKFLWALTRKGFEVIKHELPLLREEGFKSENQEHDYLVTAIHLGDSILDNADASWVFTEQELRRYDPELYPEWVPKSSLHRCDGLWKIGVGSDRKIFGLEVELSSKRDCDYHLVSKHYSRHTGINGVIWVCPSNAMARRLHRLVRDKDESQEDKHCFFTVPDFQSDGWGASCKFGGQVGKTLREILRKTDGRHWESIPAQLLCDRHKRRTTFEAYSLAHRTAKPLLRCPNP